MEAVPLSEISGEVLDAGERIELTLDTVAFSLRPHVLDALTSALLMLGDRARQEREKNPIHSDGRGFGMALRLVGAQLGHMTAAESDKLEALAAGIPDYL